MQRDFGRWMASQGLWKGEMNDTPCSNLSRPIGRSLTQTHVTETPTSTSNDGSKSHRSNKTKRPSYGMDIDRLYYKRKRKDDSLIWSQDLSYTEASSKLMTLKDGISNSNSNGNHDSVFGYINKEGNRINHYSGMTKLERIKNIFSYSKQENEDAFHDVDPQQFDALRHVKDAQTAAEASYFSFKAQLDAVTSNASKTAIPDDTSVEQPTRKPVIVCTQSQSPTQSSEEPPTQTQTERPSCGPNENKELPTEILPVNQTPSMHEEISSPNTVHVSPNVSFKKLQDESIDSAAKPADKYDDTPEIVTETMEISDLHAQDTDVETETHKSTYVEDAQKVIDNLIQYEENEFRHIMKDPSFKAMRISIKKNVTRSMNQLAGTKAQIRSVIDKLISVMDPLNDRKKTEINQRMYKFSLVYIAEAMSEQCETQLKTQPKAVWPLAWFLISLASHFHEFASLCEGKLNQKCRLAIPQYVRKTKKMNGEEFMKQRGQNQGEPEDRYQQRMSSYIRLKIAVFICSNDQKSCWLYLARLLNQPCDLTTAVTLHAAMETCAFFMIRKYRRQFAKLVDYTWMYVMPHLLKLRETHPNQCGTAVARLHIFLDEYKKTGTFPVPEGYNIKDESSELRRDT